MSIAIVSHEYTHGTQHAILDFALRRSIPWVIMISNPLPDFDPMLHSRARIYKNGSLQNEYLFPPVRAPESLLYLKDLIATIVLFLKARRKFSIYVGADSINTLAGIVLKRLGFTCFVVYLGHSYISRRFGSLIKDFIYRILDTICVRYADALWSLTKRLTNMRLSQNIPKEKSVWAPEVIDPRSLSKPYPSPLIRRGIVFLGHLKNSAGVKLMIQAMKQVVERVPDAKLLVIGIGPADRELREMVEELDLVNTVEFRGYMEYKDALELMKSYAIGLAPYAPLPDSYIWTTDPSKPKDYISVGLPVVMTRTGETAQDIEEREAGIITPYHSTELSNAIVQLLLDDKLYFKCRANALSLAREYDLESTFIRIWQDTLGHINPSKFRAANHFCMNEFHLAARLLGVKGGLSEAWK